MTMIIGITLGLIAGLIIGKFKEWKAVDEVESNTRSELNELHAEIIILRAQLNDDDTHIEEASEDPSTGE